MTIRDDILQAVRQWFVLTLALADGPNQIIAADKKGPRPPIPYLTVKITTADIAVGVDESIEGQSGGAPTVTPRGQRMGSVSVQGFGSLTSEWLQDATLGLRRQDVQLLLSTAGLTVTTLGSGSLDLSAFLDTAFEHRYLKEYQIGYAVVGTEEILTELTTVETGLTLISEPNDPNPLVVDITTPV